MELYFSGIVVYLAVHIVKGNAAATSVEFDLIYNLTLPANYDVNARPVASANDTVNVVIDVGFQQIIDLHEPTQIMTTDVYLRLYWTDVSLVWDPAENDNITSVRIYARRIWRPDITLYNDVSTERREAEKLYPVIVTYQGNVSWFSPTIFISSCQLDMTYFPWDTQQCQLELGSWTYDSSKVRVRSTSSSADISVFMENGEYDLDGMPAELNTKHYPCCEAPYETIIYTIQVTRKPMFYIFNLILPCMFVSFVGLFVFLLPPNCGEKVSLSVTVLLASTVFLMIVAESVPPQSSTVPLVSRYFEAVMLMLALTTIVTVLVINIHHRGDYYSRPPAILRVLLFDWIAVLVFMRDHVIRNTKSHRHEKEGTIASHEEMLPENVKSVKTAQILHHGGATLVNEINNESPLSTKLLFEIWQELRQVKTGKTQVSEGEAISHTEWELVAMVLDRVFLICFFIASVVTTMAILIR